MQKNIFLPLNLFLNHTSLEFPARTMSWTQGSTAESYMRSLRGPSRTARFNIRNLMCTWFSRDLQKAPSITSSAKESKTLNLSYLPCSDSGKSKIHKIREIQKSQNWPTWAFMTELWNVISAHSHDQVCRASVKKSSDTLHGCAGCPHFTPQLIQLSWDNMTVMTMEWNKPKCLSSLCKYNIAVSFN